MPRRQTAVHPPLWSWMVVLRWLRSRESTTLLVVPSAHCHQENWAIRIQKSKGRLNFGCLYSHYASLCLLLPIWTPARMDFEQIMEKNWVNENVCLAAGVKRQRSEADICLTSLNGKWSALRCLWVHWRMHQTGNCENRTNSANVEYWVKVSWADTWLLRLQGECANYEYTMTAIYNDVLAATKTLIVYCGAIVVRPSYVTSYIERVWYWLMVNPD